MAWGLQSYINRKLTSPQEIAEAVDPIFKKYRVTLLGDIYANPCKHYASAIGEGQVFTRDSYGHSGISCDAAITNLFMELANDIRRAAPPSPGLSDFLKSLI